MIGIFMFISSRGGLMMMITTCIAMFEQVSGGRLYVEPTWRSWFRFSCNPFLSFKGSCVSASSSLLTWGSSWSWISGRFAASDSRTSPPLPRCSQPFKTFPGWNKNFPKGEQGLNKGWTRVEQKWEGSLGLNELLKEDWANKFLSRKSF